MNAGKRKGYAYFEANQPMPTLRSRLRIARSTSVRQDSDCLSTKAGLAGLAKHSGFEGR